MLILTIIYIVMVPLAYKWQMDLRMIQEFAYQGLSVLLIFGGLFFNNKPVKRDMFLMGVGGFGIVTLFVWYNSNMGWSILLNTFLGIGVFFTLIRTLEVKHVRTIFKVLIGMAVFAILYRGLQYLGYDLRRQFTANAEGVTPDCSFFGLKTAYGMYLAAILPLVYVWVEPLLRFMAVSGTKLKITGKIAVNVLIIGVFIGVIGVLFTPITVSFSTGAMAGAVIATLFFFWFRKRIVVWILIIPLLIGAGLFLVKMDNPQGMQMSRLNMWGKVVQDSWHAPLGHGLDSFRNPGKKIEQSVELVRYFKNAFNDRTIRTAKTYTITNIAMQDWRPIDKISEDEVKEVAKRKEEGVPQLDFWDHPHNEYIWLFYELGFPGVLAFLFLLWAFWQRFWCSTKSIEAIAVTASIVAFGIFSITQFPLHLSRIGHLLPVLGAIFFITTEPYGTD